MRGESENMHDIAEIQWPGIEYHNVKISAVPVVTRGMMRGGGMLKDPSAKHAPSTFDSNDLRLIGSRKSISIVPVRCCMLLRGYQP